MFFTMVRSLGVVRFLGWGALEASRAAGGVLFWDKSVGPFGNEGWLLLNLLQIQML